MSATIVDQSVIVVLTCYKCGIRFGVPQRFMEVRKQDRGLFYCPCGHEQAFRPDEVDRLKNQVARLISQKDQADAEAANQRQQRCATERRLIAQKAAKTRLKNRIKNGVCPCCDRFFKELHRHMETQHPEFVPGND